MITDQILVTNRTSRHDLWRGVMYKLSAIMSILVIQGCEAPNPSMAEVEYRVSGTAIEKRIEYYDDNQEFQIEELSSTDWRKSLKIEMYADTDKKAILRVINLSGTGYIHASISYSGGIVDSTTSSVIALLEYDV